MKRIWNILGILALAVLVALIIAAAAHADPKPPAAGPYVTGSVAIDTPVIGQPDRMVDRSPAFHACLQLHNLIGHVAFVGSGDIQLRPGAAYWGENRLRAGFELPVGHGITPYVTFERRFDVDDNRYIAGVRWDFSSREQRGPKGPLTKAMSQLLLGDCLDLMQTLTPNSVDLILADPPHGRTQARWDRLIPLDALWGLCSRVLKPHGTVVLFGTQPFTSQLIRSNLKWYRYSWVWEKSKASGWLNAKRRPMAAHEDIPIFSPSSPRYFPQMRQGEPYDKGLVKAQSVGDVYGAYGRVVVKSEGSRYPRSVLYYRTAESEGNWHKSQKPIALLRYLIETYSLPGEVILDYAMGSASTGIACLETRRKFVGMEKDEPTFNRATARLKHWENQS